MTGAKPIRDWLGELGLGQHAETFEREQVDLDALRHLSEENLKDLGLPMGHRVKLLAAIRALQETPGPTPGKQQAVSPHTYTPRHLADKILTSRSALEGERKQVTVLFCDIANSTSLAERLGEERMHALLNRFFELALAQVHRYEGTINQFLGDGFMALFGAPLAHEDHARRAVLAALDIQHALAEATDFEGLAVRMGLNTGPVVVGKIGDNLRMDYTAVGDTTNLAARLQQHADPGAILIGQSTERLVVGYIRSELLPPMQVKGKSEPIAGFKVLGPGPRRSPLEGRSERVLSRFVGRERELAALGDLLGAVEATRGQAVGIVGEAGVGKSRLLYEFHHGLSGRAISYLEGRCLSFGSAIPYLPVLDLLRARCGITDEDTQDTAARKVAGVLREAEDDEALPYLLLLLGIKEGAAGLHEVSPETIKARTFHALRQVLIAACRSRPLVVAIEDLHWVDRTSEEFLGSLVESLSGVRMLLLATYRHGYRPPWMDQSYATQLALHPLSAQDSRVVVASALASGALGEELAQSIVHKGEGNPFFLEELARSVATAGAEHVREALPDTIQALLLARIDRIAEGSKRLLQTAAVLGREAALRLLRETYDATPDLDAALHELKRQEFMFERSGGREPMLVFKHVLTQEAAYESLLKSHRTALHEAAGRALERLYAGRLEEQYDLLAYHYSRSANAEKAIEYLIHANKKAMNADAPVEAKAYFERALKRLEGLPDTEANRRRRIALLADQIVVFQNLFKMQEYYELLTRYEPLAVDQNDPVLLGPLIQQIGHCDWTFGRFEQADQRFKVAAQLLEKTGNYTVAAQTYQIWMWNHLNRGDFHEVLRLREAAERAWEKGRNLRWYVYALSAAALAYGYLGRYSEGIEEGRKALTVAEEWRDTPQLSFAAWALALVYMCNGDLSRAVECAALGVEKAPTPAERAWAQGMLAAAWCRAGQFDKAIEILAPLYQALRSSGFVPGERFALFLGEAYWRAGRYDEARLAIEEGLEIHVRHGMKYETAVSRYLLAEVLAATNSSRTDHPAEPYFKESIDALQRIGAEGDLARALAGCGRLRARQGRIPEAREYLGEALRISERLGTIGGPERLRAELNGLPAP